MCEHLEAVLAGDVRRLLVNVPPGFMKSLLTNVFFPAWCWSAMDRADLRFVTFSYAAHLTERDNGRFRDLIRSREFLELWGHKFSLTEEGKVKVANDKTGWKFASSVSGVGTGERGDLVMLDDPHSVKESESDVVRKETVRWFEEAMSNRLNDMKTGAIIVIMQRVHEEDVSGVILQRHPEYEHLCVPMEYEPDRHCETLIGWQDWRTEAGELAWPARFDEESILPFKRLPFMYAGQYQQRPSPRGGGILPLSGWELWDQELALKYGRNENQFPEIEYAVASLDTAYTVKQQNDFSACVVLGVWRDIYNRPKIIVMAAWKERLELNPLVMKIIQTCRRLGVDRLLIEGKASGKSVAQEVRRLVAEEEFGVTEINPGNQDKLARAYSIQHLLGEQTDAGRRDGIVFVPCVTSDNGSVLPRQFADSLMSSCAVFPKGAHDDDVDALVMALRFLRDAGLARRSDEMAAQEERDLMLPAKGPAPLYPA